MATAIEYGLIAGLVCTIGVVSTMDMTAYKDFRRADVVSTSPTKLVLDGQEVKDTCWTGAKVEQVTLFQLDGQKKMMPVVMFERRRGVKNAEWKVSKCNWLL